MQISSEMFKIITCYFEIVPYGVNLNAEFRLQFSSQRMVIAKYLKALYTRGHDKGYASPQDRVLARLTT